ncbi:MAG: DUF3592 domain-containing protein [Kineosporiaceae bacterium]
MGERALALVGVLPMLVGVAAVVSSWRTASRERRLVRRGRRVVATVVDNQIRSTSDGGLTFAPVVEFFTATEQKVRADVPGAVRPISYVPGEQLVVHHDPTDPQRLVTGRSAGPVVGVVVGLGFLGFGVLWVWSVTSWSRWG